VCLELEESMLFDVSWVQVFITKHFSNPTHKTESETANRWETTNSNQQHGPIKLSSQIRNKEQSINTIWLYLLACSKAPPEALQRLSRRSENLCTFSGSQECLPVDWLDLTNEPHPRFSVQGDILIAGGDALRIQPPSSLVMSRICILWRWTSS